MRLLKDKAIINGEWVSAKSKATFDIRNPRNGEKIGAVPHMDATDTELAITAAYEAKHPNMARCHRRSTIRLTKKMG